jgi:hypothetical protein
VNKFCGFKSAIDRLNESGKNEQDRVCFCTLNWSKVYSLQVIFQNKTDYDLIGFDMHNYIGSLDLINVDSPSSNHIFIEAADWLVFSSINRCFLCVMANILRKIKHVFFNYFILIMEVWTLCEHAQKHSATWLFLLTP